MPVGHQPDDAGGHRLGLARAGARDHHGRDQVGLDDLGLLVGRRRQAEQPVQFGGPDDRTSWPCSRATRRRITGYGAKPDGAHVVTWRPSDCSGQLALTSHIRQSALMLAVNSLPRSRAATRATSSAIQSGSSAVAERALPLLGVAGGRQLDEQRATGHGTGLESAVCDGQLIRAELRVLGEFVGTWFALAGLEVDDHDSSFGVALEPVDAAAQSCVTDVDGERLLDADQLQVAPGWRAATRRVERGCRPPAVARSPRTTARRSRACSTARRAAARVRRGRRPEVPRPRRRAPRCRGRRRPDRRPSRRGR